MPGFQDRAKRPQPEYRPGHPGYVSEFEQFMDSYLAQHPEVVEDQRKGWDIFWDHEVDVEEMDQAGRDRVPLKGYDYF